MTLISVNWNEREQEEERNLRESASAERWTPSFGQENAEIKLGSQALQN